MGVTLKSVTREIGREGTVVLRPSIRSQEYKTQKYKSSCAAKWKVDIPGRGEDEVEALVRNILMV